MITLKINGIDFEIIKVQQSDEEEIRRFVLDLSHLKWEDGDFPWWNDLLVNTKHGLGTLKISEGDYILRIPNGIKKKKTDEYMYTTLPSDIFDILLKTTLDGKYNQVRDDSRGSNSSAENGSSTANAV